MKTVKISDTALSGVNIVPVIGVTLVLLVILIVLSPIMNLPNLPVDLPEAVTKETKEKNLTVSLSADGGVSVDTQIIDWETLPGTLRAVLKDKEPETVIIIRGDRNLPYGMVERLIRVVNRNSMGHAVALGTRQRRQVLEMSQQ